MIVFLALFSIGGILAQPRISCEQIPAAVALVKSVHALNPDVSAIVSSTEFKRAFVDTVEQHWPIFTTSEANSFFTAVGFSTNILDENVCRTLEAAYNKYVRAISRSITYLPRQVLENSDIAMGARDRILQVVANIKDMDPDDFAEFQKEERAKVPEQLLELWIRNLAYRVYLNELALRDLSQNALQEAYDIVNADFNGMRAKMVAKDLFPSLLIRTIMRQLDSRSEYLTVDDANGSIFSRPGNPFGNDHEAEFVRGLRGPYLLRPTFVNLRYLNAQFRFGDQITTVGGVSMAMKTDLETRTIFEKSAKEDLKVTFLRSGQEMSVSLQPIVVGANDSFDVEIRRLPAGPLALIRPTTTDFKPIDLKNKILESHKKGVRGFILDFRNLALEVTEDWVRVFELFENRAPRLADYMVASRAGQLVPVFFNPADQIIREAIVILTNRKTAGWPECFAGALQKYSRGLVVSEAPTAGRVEIQTRGDIPWWRNTFSGILSADLFSMLWYRPPPGILNITTSYAYLADGSAIQGRGVIPDVRIGEGWQSRQASILSVEPKRQAWFDLHPDENMMRVKSYTGQLDTLRSTVRQLFLQRTFDGSNLEMSSSAIEVNSAFDVLGLWVQLDQRNNLSTYDKKM